MRASRGLSVATSLSQTRLGRRAKRASLLRDKSDVDAGPAILATTPPSLSCSTTQFSHSLSHSHRMPHASGRTPTNALRQPGIGHDGHPLGRCWEMLAWCNGWWRRPRETGNEGDMDWKWRNGSRNLDMGCPPPMPNTQAQPAYLTMAVLPDSCLSPSLLSPSASSAP